MGSAAVFLDRDGVLNRNVHYPDTGEWESPRSPKDLVLHDAVIPALERLQAAGYQLFVVSNQPSYAKGKVTLEALHQTHARLEAVLVQAGINVRAFYYCYHHPHGVVADYSGPCQCRKPSPYFLLQAQEVFDLDLSCCWMVGDRDSDIACGQAAGVRTIQIAPDHPGAKAGQATPTAKAQSLDEASRIISMAGYPG